MRRKSSNVRQDATSHSSTTEIDDHIPYESHDQELLDSVPESEDACDPAATQYAQYCTNGNLSNQCAARHSPPSGESTASLGESLSSIIESLDTPLTWWSEKIFHNGIDTILGLLVGRNGCPFVYV